MGVFGVPNGDAPKLFCVDETGEVSPKADVVLILAPALLLPAIFPPKIFLSGCAAEVVPNILVPVAGLAEPPNMFEVGCGEVSDNDVLTELAPNILAVVLVVLAL